MNYQKDKQYVLYKHTSPRGKVYIGITSKAPAARWGKNGNNYKNNKHFWSAIQKYGWDNFSHEILLSGLSLDEACAREVALIKETKSDCADFGYNIAPGGQITTQALSTRRKISEANRRRFENPDARKRQSEISKKMWSVQSFREAHSGENAPRYGKHLSEESRKKISDARKNRRYESYGRPAGWHWSEEHKKKLSQKLLSMNMKMSDEAREKIAEAKRGNRNPNYGKPMSEKCKNALLVATCKPVRQILNGKTIAIFESSADASRQTGIDSTNINRCANGKRMTAGGYSWEFS